MELILDSEEYQGMHLQVLSLIKSMITDEEARFTILQSVFIHFEERSKKVQFIDEKSIAIYLRLLAKQFCENFLKVTNKI